jgi:shikimate dehydrogenase
MGIPYAEVIGDPIAHSKSPLIHNFWLERLGVKGEYRRARVSAAELGSYFAERRADPLWRGCNVTMPHKLAVVGQVDILSPEVRRIGAVNTVARSDGALIGLNTDWQGLDLALPAGAARAKDVVLIGAGGGARGALEALRLATPRWLTIVNRDVPKARRLLQEFGLEGTAAGLDTALPTADLLINASALGMSGYPPLQLDLSPLRCGAVVLDMVYEPLETPLLRDARQKGLTAIDGLAMLIRQASMAFRSFFGTGCDEADTPELRVLLAA